MFVCTQTCNDLQTATEGCKATSQERSKHHPNSHLPGAPVTTRKVPSFKIKSPILYFLLLISFIKQPWTWPGCIPHLQLFLLVVALGQASSIMVAALVTPHSLLARARHSGVAMHSRTCAMCPMSHLNSQEAHYSKDVTNTPCKANISGSTRPEFAKQCTV